MREAIEAGALGFSTSRTIKHRDSQGVTTPSITAHAGELVGIATALGSTGTRVVQGISDFVDFDAEFETFRSMAEASGRRTSITVEQHGRQPRLVAPAPRCMYDGASTGGATVRAARGSRSPS